MSSKYNLVHSRVIRQVRANQVGLNIALPPGFGVKTRKNTYRFMSSGGGYLTSVHSEMIIIDKLKIRLLGKPHPNGC